MDNRDAVLIRHSSRAKARSDCRYLLVEAPVGNGRTAREYQCGGVRLLVGLDGKGQEKVTNEPTFDGFPMFSPDGRKLVWASNRNAKSRGDTNIFVADWVW